MNLKNKLFLVLFVSLAFLFLLSSRTFARTQASSQSNWDNMKNSFYELPYSDANEFLGVIDSDTVRDYPYIVVLQCVSNGVTYKCAYFTKTTDIMFHPILEDNGSTTLLLEGNNKDAIIFNNNILTHSSTGFSTVNNNNGVTSYWCNYDLPIYYYSGGSYHSTSFFLAKSEMLPLPLALQTVSRSLVPQKIMGTLAEIVPVAIVVFSAFLVIFLIRSKIWRPV